MIDVFQMNAARKYRRRPLIVSAMQLTEESLLKVAQWCGATPHPQHISLDTEGGSIIFLIGDWVVREAGAFVRVPHSLFAAMYEEIHE